jgi:hypothetical protein
MSIKNDRIDTVPQVFIGQIQRLLPEIYAQLISRISIEIVNGQIARTQANVNAVFQIVDEFEQYLLNPKSPYYRSVAGFMGEFETQRLLNNQLLAAFGEAPTSAQVVYAAARRQTVELLVGEGFKTNFVNVIRDTMIESVSSARSFTEMVSALSTQIEGVKITKDGQEVISQSQLLNWNKQVAHDRFAMTDRAYVQAAADELDVQWFKYTGGLIEDSREFCVEKDQQIFHRSEIEAWPDTEGDWAGRMKGTDSQTIFNMLGGYRCNHSLTPWPESQVPKEKREQFAGK